MMRNACVLRRCLLGNWDEQDKASNDRQTDQAFFGKSSQSEFKNYLSGYTTSNVSELRIIKSQVL